MVVIFLFVHYGGVLGAQLRREMGQDFNPQTMLIFTAVFPMLAGILLGVPHFLSSVKSSGTWRFNLPKFLIVGIPALIGNWGIFFFYLNPENKAAELFSWANVWGVQGITVCGILFGYTLLTVMEKRENQNIFIDKKTGFFR
jgi:hypothetical protein